MTVYFVAGCVVGAVFGGSFGVWLGLVLRSGKQADVKPFEWLPDLKERKP